MLKISWSELYCHPLPEGHRFPMEKYTLIPEQLRFEGTVNHANFYDPGLMDEEIVLLTHNKTYWNKLKTLTLSPKEIRKAGFPLSERLVRRGLSIANGTLHNTLNAMKYGVGMNIAGGTHHAFADRGEGFCLLNDIAIAANWLLHTKRIGQALVIDLDVHQGNGTASIFRSESRVFTFSMHCEANYPLQKEPSDLDIGLPPGTGDELYFRNLAQAMPVLIEKLQPDLIFYLSGVDILHTDKLGKLACTLEGCKRRDEYIFSLCQKYNIPVSVSLGGGYSPRIRDIVEAHCNTFRLAQNMWF